MEGMGSANRTKMKENAVYISSIMTKVLVVDNQRRRLNFFIVCFIGC